MKILVSACIMGDNCKYNGGNNFNPSVVNLLSNHKVIKICPELLAGMPTPRKCAELVHGKVIDSTGKNVHHEYLSAVQAAMEQIKIMDIDLVVLQSRSPTCGAKNIYDGSFTGKLIEGKGLFAKALIDAGYHVIDVSDFETENK